MFQRSFRETFGPEWPLAGPTDTLKFILPLYNLQILVSCNIICCPSVTFEWLKRCTDFNVIWHGDTLILKTINTQAESRAKVSYKKNTSWRWTHQTIINSSHSLHSWQSDSVCKIVYIGDRSGQRLSYKFPPSHPASILSAAVQTRGFRLWV